jgi:hypothetical protein
MKKIVLIATAFASLTMAAYADVGWSKKDYLNFYGAPVKKMGQVSTAGETVSVYVYQDELNNIVVAFDNSGHSIQEVIAPTPE